MVITVPFNPVSDKCLARYPCYQVNQYLDLRISSIGFVKKTSQLAKNEIPHILDQTRGSKGNTVNQSWHFILWILKIEI